MLVEHSALQMGADLEQLLQKQSASQSETLSASARHWEQRLARRWEH